MHDHFTPRLLVAFALLVASCADGANDTAPGSGAGGDVAGSSASSGGSSGQESAAGGGAGGGSTGGGAPGSAGTAIQDQDSGSQGGGGGNGGSGGASPADAGRSTDAAASPSDGCGKPAGQALETYVKYMEMVEVPAKYSTFANRVFYVRLPPGYEPTRAYPTVFLGPGCGGNGMQVIPIQNAAKGDAIVVGMNPVNACFMTEAGDSPDIAYFDETLKQVESKFCVDKKRIFVAGFSSGSWLSNLLGCARGGVIRAQANATGCSQGSLPTCAGPIPAMLAHDMADGNNAFSCGVASRDRLLKLNGCTTETEIYDPGTGKANACVIYKNCTSGQPVVWCPTTGQGHSDQVATGLSTTGFWKFWSSLP